jgi:hypothetical protein
MERIPEIHTGTTELETLKTTLPILAAEFGAEITPTSVSFDIDDVVLSDDCEEVEYAFGGYTVKLNNYPILHTNIISREYYTIVAKDPIKAYANHTSDYPHPHINNNMLCEGDASVAIRNALLAGDLVSFLLIVNSVVNTYFADGAYRQLYKWLKEERELVCNSCDAAITENDVYICDECGVELCYECANCCNCCENYYCSDHIRYCNVCEMSYCRYCYDDHMEQCECCGTKICSSTMLKCSECGNYVCEECIHVCKKCNASICATCAISRSSNVDQLPLFDANDADDSSIHYCPTCATTLGIEDN